MKRFLLLLLVILPGCAQQTNTSKLKANKSSTNSTNQIILAATRSIPNGGGYEASQKAVDRLAASVTNDGKTIQHNLKKNGASFCSGATYLILLHTINHLQNSGQLNLPPNTLSRYAKCGVDDGEEIFGRWNSNGPGTAKLFADLKCGTNFTSYQHAQPGDFMKMWWTKEIGKKERGHLVVYLSQTPTTITYWSSNQPNGYGTKTTHKEKIKQVLFSRLTKPSALANGSNLPAKDPFLADMLHKDFTWQQVVKSCKVKSTP